MMSWSWLLLFAENVAADGMGDQRSMTTWAWVFMFAAWAVIIGCLAYCYSKLLFSPRGLGDDQN